MNMSKTKDFIDAIAKGDKTSINSAFKDLISSKVNMILDIKKIALTSEVFKKVSEEGK